MSLPLIGITMGDPAGVGPETIVGAWQDPQVHEFCRPVVIGHPEVVQRAIDLLNSDARVKKIESLRDVRPSATVIPCLKAVSDNAARTPPAKIDARGGQAAYEALLVAAKLALSGELDALTTAPLHKAALWEAGHKYPGHTELLAELCNVRDFAMMLYLPPGDAVRATLGLSIVHVTLHMALENVFASITQEAILSKARLIDGFVRKLTGSAPRIGVSALNPHAGEQGLFGTQELEIIAPAVKAAQTAGLNATGPLPADTLIARARDGEFDAIVAMYHDQGHIAIKLLAMHRAVNVTLGLPIVRTSVAHGTAFDLAWQGRAETTGMVEALRVASRLAAEKPQ